MGKHVSLWGSQERKNGQVDAWISVKLCMKADGHVRKAIGTGSDGLLQVRIGRSSQQAGRSLDCPIIYRGLRFKYFSQAR